MILSILHPLATSVLLASSGPAFPKLSIESICQSTVVADRSHLTLHSCRHDERAARDDLRKRWARLSSKDRASCAGQALSISPSYVDLQGCIDSAVEVRREEKQ